MIVEKAPTGYLIVAGRLVFTDGDKTGAVKPLDYGKNGRLADCYTLEGAHLFLRRTQVNEKILKGWEIRLLDIADINEPLNIGDVESHLEKLARQRHAYLLWVEREKNVYSAGGCRKPSQTSSSEKISPEPKRNRRHAAPHYQKDNGRDLVLCAARQLIEVMKERGGWRYVACDPAKLVLPDVKFVRPKTPTNDRPSPDFAPRSDRWVRELRYHGPSSQARDY